MAAGRNVDRPRATFSPGGGGHGPNLLDEMNDAWSQIKGRRARRERNRAIRKRNAEAGVPPLPSAEVVRARLAARRRDAS